MSTFLNRQIDRNIRRIMPALTYLFEHRTLDQRLSSYAVIKALRPNVRRLEQEALAYIEDSVKATPFEISRDLGFSAIELDPELVGLCVEDTQQRLQTAQSSGRGLRNKKGYLQALTNLSDYDSESVPFKLATSGDLVKMVARYLGGAPVLWNIAAMYSPPSARETVASAQWRGSQYWHRDAEDIASVKVWILCSDVELDNGPTFCLPRKLSDKIARNIGYKQGEKILDDRLIDPYEDEIFSLVGKTGNTFTTDTCRCFHMGSRTIDERGRLVLMFNFVSRYSLYFWPVFSSVTSRKLNPKVENLSRVQKDLLFPYF